MDHENDKRKEPAEYFAVPEVVAEQSQKLRLAASCSLARFFIRDPHDRFPSTISVQDRGRTPVLLSWIFVPIREVYETGEIEAASDGVYDETVVTSQVEAALGRKTLARLQSRWLDGYVFISIKRGGLVA